MGFAIIDRLKISGEARHPIRTMRRQIAQRDLRSVCDSENNMNTQAGDVGRDTQRVVRDVQTILDNR